jgi:GTP cyclohydrolase I
MTTKQQATKVIVARDPNAHSVCEHGNNNFSARIGYMTAYYVIINGVITGDVWYE